jgi:hypothetical protein
MNNNHINDSSVDIDIISSVDIENLFQPNSSSIEITEIITDYISGSADETSGNLKWNLIVLKINKS